MSPAAPSISFIIPVLNEEGTIAALLEHLASGYPLAERVVVDGGSQDATVARAMPLCHSLLTSGPGRSVQMNLGASVAGGDYLVFLHADSTPTVDSDVLEAALSENPSWGFCRVQLDGQRPAYRVIERAMNLRSRLTRVATGDQMLFVSAKAFSVVGAYADIPLMEDVDICKRLRRESPPCILVDPVQTSARRWESGGLVLTVLRMWCLRLGYFFGVSPERLWRYYYG